MFEDIAHKAKKHTEEFFQKVERDSHNAIAANMNPGNKSGYSENNPRGVPSFNSGKQLRSASGKYQKSFRLKDKNTKTKIVVNQYGGTLTIGSKLEYAVIQEYGGFIRTKGDMHKFFFAKWKETGHIFWWRMFLAVKKNKGVHIKGRFTITNAMIDIEKDFIPKQLNNLLERIVTDANAAK